MITIALGRVLMLTAGALLVGLLSAAVLRSIADNPTLPPGLHSQIDLDNITFVSNDRLQDALRGTTVTPDQIAEAVRINQRRGCAPSSSACSSWQGWH
jgi:hypothetical protein